MEKGIVSGFQFTGFFIEESHFKVSIGAIIQADVNLDIELGCEGIHYVKDNKFDLIIRVKINDKEGAFECMITSRGKFEIILSDDNISDYFYVNAPAIMFPYIRAYISTLTNLSTSGHSITLPTLKLDLKDTLKANIKIIE